jgi:hypothetical protein
MPWSARLYAFLIISEEHDLSSFRHISREVMELMRKNVAHDDNHAFFAALASRLRSKQGKGAKA